jgi:hypothetical protein
VSDPQYTEFEMGERQALLQLRSFIIKHGKDQVDDFCAQRLHDIKMDARHRQLKSPRQFRFPGHIGEGDELAR